MQIRNLEAALGAEVLSVELAAPLRKSEVDAIETAWRARVAESGGPCQKRLRGDSSDSIAERRWPSVSLLMRYWGSSPAGGMSCVIWYTPVPNFERGL